ncbi:DUF1152 domain-containing protein [Alysiella crassa]|uniref:Uncharacterized protein conserved in archaea n=2 Tax=Alysiella crassa TaxID=153491 RepID=A0A376BM76_9NEIS|nr:DUF1152 domain-containing protein [Alysiella crassa]SSY70780.1 Uncharacterized protein conserved in archaea [Alysiella crassa]
MQIPFFQKIPQGQRFLLAGCGGGYDIITAIPLYFYLKSLGKEVVLANLSFTDLANSNCEMVLPDCYLIDGKAKNLAYFPEKLLRDWLKQQNEQPMIYAFRNSVGVQPLRQIYQYLKKQHCIDTLVLADGGTDSLMFGDELGVATIVEDSLSILASAKAGFNRAYLMAVGFGVEKFHGLDHYPCLQNIATLTKKGAYLGAFSLTPDMAEGQKYLDFLAYEKQNAQRNSIVNHSIANAMCGEFGDYHSLAQTKGSEQFINPFMPLYWHFELQAIAQEIVFADKVEHSQTLQAFYDEYEIYRLKNRRRKGLRELPI